MKEQSGVISMHHKIVADKEDWIYLKFICPNCKMLSFAPYWEMLAPHERPLMNAYSTDGVRYFWHCSNCMKRVESPSRGLFTRDDMIKEMRECQLHFLENHQK